MQKCWKFHISLEYTRNRLPLHLRQKESAIVNLDAANENSTHWVAYKKIGDKIEYYDSFEIYNGR